MRDEVSCLSKDMGASDTQNNRGNTSSDSPLSITLPWPPKELSPNFRTRSTRWIARIKADYRAKVAETAWQRGVQPGRGLRLDRIVFHPPTANVGDIDNYTARMKAGQDGLADAMGVDDQTFNDAPREIGAVVKGGAVVVLLSEMRAE